MSIRLLLLGCPVTALGIAVSSHLVAACLPGSIEKVIVKECVRKDAEWAMVTLADNTAVRYRAYYLVIPYEGRNSEAAEYDFLSRINPCNTISLNREVSLRREVVCCDAGSSEEVQQCEQSARDHSWYEAMEPKELHIPGITPNKF